jgi:hypothetical protein
MDFMLFRRFYDQDEDILLEGLFGGINNMLYIMSSREWETFMITSAMTVYKFHHGFPKPLFYQDPNLHVIQDPVVRSCRIHVVPGASFDLTIALFPSVIPFKLRNLRDGVTEEDGVVVVSCGVVGDENSLVNLNVF